MRRESAVSRWTVLLLVGFGITQFAQGQGAKRLTGTGFVVDTNGYLLTAAHVVKDATKVEVTLGDKTYNAAVVATDERRDLALLEIKANGLTTLPLGNSNAVEVGEEVRAFGFPLTSVLGEGVKVTRGIVSGIEIKDTQKVFQIDAPINPGNSGGPLTNEKGEVIAVINAKLAGTLVSNVGFAVPINYAKTMLRDNGAEFATEGSKTKLEGPALVKRISPAVALVMVTLRLSESPTFTPSLSPSKRKPPVSPAKTEEMKKAQEAALDELKRKGVTPPDGMVLVPAGEFIMGSDDGDRDEKPTHRVYLDAFWIDKCEVTNEQYAKFLDYIKRTGDHIKCFNGEPLSKDHTPHYWNDGQWNGAKQPVIGVDWYDAYAYAVWAGKRLPTETEWEKAARGTDGREYPWGNEWDGGFCCWSGNSNGVTKNVGSFPQGVSPYGTFDMAGNVWEWCADWYDRYPSISANEVSRNPKGPARGQWRVLRGGSWYANGAGDFRCAYRYWYAPNFRYVTFGFRCAQDSHIR